MHTRHQESDPRSPLYVLPRRYCHHCEICGQCGDKREMHCSNPECNRCYNGNMAVDIPCDWCGKHGQEQYEVQKRMVLNELIALRQSDPKRIHVTELAGGLAGGKATAKGQQKKKERSWVLSETAAGADVEAVDASIASLVREQEASEARASEEAQEDDYY